MGDIRCIIVQRTSPVLYRVSDTPPKSCVFFRKKMQFSEYYKKHDVLHIVTNNPPILIPPLHEYRPPRPNFACLLLKPTVYGKNPEGVFGRPKQGIPKTHDLVRLYKLCGSPMRYPDALPGTLPDRNPTEKDAKMLLNLAEKILTLVGKHVGKLNRTP